MYVVARWIKTSLVIPLVGLALGGASIQLLYAQQGAIRPSILQKGDIADIPGREVVTAILELPPNGAAARHTHPGTEIGYVLEGSATLMIEGQAAREMKAGDSWIIGAGIPHEGRAGPAGVKVLGTFVVEKGKPLATPAP
jgi:quercetin dioxygenase-like cupin family protein